MTDRILSLLLLNPRNMGGKKEKPSWGQKSQVLVSTLRFSGQIDFRQVTFLSGTQMLICQTQRLEIKLSLVCLPFLMGYDSIINSCLLGKHYKLL